MPIQQPSEETIRDLGLNTFRNLVGNSFAARYQQSFTYPFFAGIAKMINLAILYVKRVYEDRWIFSASEEALYQRHLPTYKVERITAAYASGFVLFTGLDGVSVPVDTSVITDSGLRFKTTATGVIASGEASIAVQAENVGSDYNLNIGASLFLENDIEGIDSDASVDQAVTGGRDLEDLESWRYRMRDSFANSFGTGSESDIKRWMGEALGNIRAFVFSRHPANGEITISYVEQNPEQIKPDTGKLGKAQVFVRDRLEAGVTVNTLDPTTYPIDFIIKILPNNLETRSAIEAGLREYFMLNSTPSLTAFPYLMPISQIREAISISAGETKHEIVQISQSGTPLTGESIAVPNQKLAIVGGLSFQSY